MCIRDRDAVLDPVVAKVLDGLERSGAVTAGELDRRVMSALAKVKHQTALDALDMLQQAGAETRINSKSAYLFKVLKKLHRDHHNFREGPLPSIFDGSLRKEKKRARKAKKAEGGAKKPVVQESPETVLSSVEVRKRQARAAKASRRRQRLKDKLKSAGDTPQVQKKRRRDQTSADVEEAKSDKHAKLREAAAQRVGHKTFVAIKNGKTDVLL
eukprot:TRINITY_DN21210_c0_g1_i1.p1 TRINITY_DN21210_c0_g1~~TRINITY_DN21210_c0_g1_i1.p1  ORF type:complete len:213 (-),score=59.13 TRINITY_DN21210_c0_g1_i1:169-807(-)